MATIGPNFKLAVLSHVLPGSVVSFETPEMTNLCPSLSYASSPKEYTLPASVPAKAFTLGWQNVWQSLILNVVSSSLAFAPAENRVLWHCFRKRASSVGGGR